MTQAEQAFQSFLDEHLRTIEPLYRDFCLAHWQASLTGSQEDAQRAAELEARFRKIYADRETLRRLEAWRESGEIRDPLLQRQLTLLILEHRENQMDPELLERIVRKQREVETLFSTHRARVGEQELTDNEIRKILKESDDVEERRAAWEGSKEVGAKVAEGVLELVELRNRVARSMGYPHYYAMALELQEQSEEQVLEICRLYKQLSDDAFRALRQEMDERLARRFGIQPQELRPWHYEDPFFQEAPRAETVDLDPFFADQDLEKLTARFYEGIGLPVDDILARSDLYEKPGKNQHAYCIDVDRKGDIRVLCNIRPVARWASTMLHEFGHAVYDKYLDSDLPFILRRPSHTFTTEAVAMLMGRQTHEAGWLRAMLGIPEDRARSTGEAATRQLREQMLVSTRWMLTMIHFERELYRNPSQDLNTLWWDMVEEFQMLRRPEGRNAPDWASKIHIACYPVYYHNYLWGEFMASQLRRHLDTQILPEGADTLAGHPEAGEFLREKVFRPGARLRWDELLVSVTGRSLGPEAFVEQFVRP
jgi:peptidyl-dipeptidase A